MRIFKSLTIRLSALLLLLAPLSAMAQGTIRGSGTGGGGGGGGTQYAEDAALGATPTGNLAIYRRDDALSALTPVADDAISGRVDQYGALWTTLSVAGAQLGVAEDDALASGAAGIPVLALRDDNCSGVSGGTEGDAVYLLVDDSGQLCVHLSETSVGVTTDTDDGSIAGAQATIGLGVSLPYAFDGTNWIRRASETLHTADSAASTNATNVKASAGTIRSMEVFSIDATPVYVTLYNTAGAPTCGTGVVKKLAVPEAPASGLSGVVPRPSVDGWYFSTGIGYCITTSEDGTGAVAANEVFINIGYN